MLVVVLRTLPYLGSVFGNHVHKCHVGGAEALKLPPPFGERFGSMKSESIPPLVLPYHQSVKASVLCVAQDAAKMGQPL